MYGVSASLRVFPRLGGALAGTKAAVDKYAALMDDVETVVACESLGDVE